MDKFLISASILLAILISAAIILAILEKHELIEENEWIEDIEFSHGVRSYKYLVCDHDFEKNEPQYIDFDNCDELPVNRSVLIKFEVGK